MIPHTRSVPLAVYMTQVEPTDMLGHEELEPVLMGLFGEVGSVMATAKKFHREKEDYTGYRHAVVEEFGDVLWYLTAICRRFQISLESIFSESIEKGVYETTISASDLKEYPIAVNRRAASISIDLALLELGKAAAALLPLKTTDHKPVALLCAFADQYLKALQASGMNFGQVVDYNIAKTCGRFLEPDSNNLPRFDDRFEAEEQIPDRFEITITQRKSGKSYLQMNGVFLGDPLTDNIRDEDGYRFHDVFHMAHAVVLHWSPVFRALLKHKRKSDPKFDETEDGGRAIVVEEGLTAWIFSQAKEIDFFRGRSTISFDILKTVQQFVRGYEVERCPLKLWEHAIIRGYHIFSEVLANNGGTIIGDRQTRQIQYRR